MKPEGNAPLLITGPSRRGKTSLIGTAAVYLRKKYGLILRLYTVDGGAYPEDVAALIDIGAIEVCRPRTRVGRGGEGLIEETCSKMAQGYWPAPGEILDPKSGILKPMCKLVPPVQTYFVLHCPAGHEVHRAIASTLLQPQQCKQCNPPIMVTLQNGKVTMDTKVSPGFERVGGIAIDGLSSSGRWIMDSLATRRAAMELHGEKDNIGRIVSGDMAFGGNNRADYGFSQSMSEKWLLASSAIPLALRIPPIWTGLESRIDESGKAAPYYAPDIPGSARSGAVSSWVGDYLGVQKVIAESGKPEYRLYLTDFYDSENVVHPYNVRASTKLPPYLVCRCEICGGDGPNEFDLGVFFEMREEARQKSSARYQNIFDGAPETPKAPEPTVEKVESVKVAGPVPVAAPAPVRQAAVAPAQPGRPTTLPPPKPPARAPQLPPVAKK